MVLAHFAPVRCCARVQHYEEEKGLVAEGMSSKSSKQRRSDDEFKPGSAKKSKHIKPEEHQSVQRIRLLDLIKYNYLSAGEEVFVKEQDGVITDRGTIKVLSSSGYIEYSNPTSWTKQVTGRENGGWGQIRLKSSKQTLSSIKEQYQKNMSSLEYIEDPEIDTSGKGMYGGDAMNGSPSASGTSLSGHGSGPGVGSGSGLDAAPSDLTLPLKVRFINDEDRVFKIIWVSPDFKEFHTEYQGTLYTNLADFVSKIFEDFQKPSSDPNAPPPGNLRFDELMYELSPGKWVRLAGNLFPSELMAQQGGQQNTDQVNYQQGIQSHLLQSHITQSPLSFSHHHHHPSGDNCNHRNNININNSTNNCNNNNNNTGVDHLNESTASHNHNTSYDDYHVSAEDEGDNNNNNDNSNNVEDEYETNRRRNSLTKSRINVVGRRSLSVHCYKSLAFVEDSDLPVRVNSFGPSSVREILYTVFNECNLKHNNGSEADLLRDYSVDIEDHDFGGVKIIFPKSVASFPTKCKIYIRRKEQPIDTTLDPSQITEKQQQQQQQQQQQEGDTSSQSFVDDKNGILLMDKDLDKELEKETHDDSMLTSDKPPSSDKEDNII